MDAKSLKIYKIKARDSFRTKLNLYLFHSALNNQLNIDLSGFEKFSITEDLVSQYTTEYWQQLKNYQIGDYSIAEIESAILNFQKTHKAQIDKLQDHYIEVTFSEIFPELEFEKLLSIEECYYCQITEKEIEQLADEHKLRKKNFRGWTLEIERFDSNLEYTPKNCTKACYWCNNAKTDEFTKEEFMDIGEVIRKIWDQRLKK